MSIWEWTGLSPAGADIWWLPATVPDEMAAMLRLALEPTERDRLAAFADPGHARDRGALWGLVRTVLARYLGCEPDELRLDRTCEYCDGDHGRPRLAGGPGPEFSLSHSGERAVLCVSGTRTGIDLEATTALPRAVRLARVILSEAEARDLGERADAGLLLRSWVRKEAFLKLCGLGLAIAPSTITIGPKSAGAMRVRQVPEKIAGYAGSVIADLPAPPGYVCALASGQVPDLITHRVVDPAGWTVARPGDRAWVGATRPGDGQPGGGGEDR
jgi:4'-phosphopantetheinyl transferase